MKKFRFLIVVFSSLFFFVSCGEDGETTFNDMLTEYVVNSYDGYQIVALNDDYELITVNYTECFNTIDYEYNDIVFSKENACESTFLGMGYLLFRSNQFLTIEEADFNELELIKYIPTKEEVTIKFVKSIDQISDETYFIYLYDKDSPYHKTLTGILKDIIDDGYQIYANEFNKDSNSNKIYPEYRDFIPRLTYKDTLNDTTETFVGGEIYNLIATYKSTNSFNHVVNNSETKVGYIGDYDIIFAPETNAMMTPSRFEYRGYIVVDGISFNEKNDLSTIGIYAYVDGEKVSIEILLEQEVFAIDDVMRFLPICEKID